MINWEEQIKLPEKAPEIEYAYILYSDEKPISCSKEELFKAIERRNDIHYVTTPQNNGFIIPGMDYDTLQPILRRRMSASDNQLFLGFFFTILFGLLYFLFCFLANKWIEIDSSFKFYLVIVGLIPIISEWYERYSIRNINESNYQQESSQIKFSYWIQQENIRSIYIVIVILVTITFLQIITGLKNSIALAGLVKPQTLNGEYWRLLTCILMHGNLFHILLNSAAISTIGLLVVRLSSFSHFLIVFLFSGLLGSISSLYLIPTHSSIGASGCIMGLIGFILVMSLTFLNSIPRKILRAILLSILWVAIMGLINYDIVDNAAHGGGLIGGIIAGLILVRRKNNVIPYQPTKLIYILGIISAVILLGGIFIIIRKLIYA